MLVDGGEEAHESVEATHASTSACAVVIGRRMQGGPPLCGDGRGEKARSVSQSFRLFRPSRGTCRANPWGQIEPNLLQSSPCRPAAHGQLRLRWAPCRKVKPVQDALPVIPPLRLSEPLLYYYTILDPGELHPFISPHLSH